MDISRLLHFIRCGAVDPWHCAHYHGGGKGSPPPAPDYRGAAEQQAQSSKEVTNMQTYANRPEMSTPWGSQTWNTQAVTDPATGQPVTQWSSQINLSPEQAKAQADQAEITSGRSEAAKTLLGQATGAFQQPFDWDTMPKTPGSLDEAQSGAYTKMSAMLEPGRERARSSMDVKLANMGLTQGTEAYKRAQADLGEQFSQQDKGLLASSLAEGRSDVGTQQQMRQAAIAEQAQKRGMTLNELNALLTGQQVSMPQMPGFTQAGASQAAGYSGAAGAAGDYGLQAQQMKNAAQPDFGALAGTAAMGAMMM